MEMRDGGCIVSVCKMVFGVFIEMHFGAICGFL